MISGEPEQFSDPVLKEAVRRAWSEKAPEGLRQRLVESMAAEAAPGGLRRPRAMLFYGTALAAVLLLAVGAGSHWYQTLVRGRGTSGQLPSAIAVAMIATHDRCRQLPDHHHLTEISRADITKIGQALSQQMGCRVMAGKPSDCGWAFRGAAVCEVGTAKSAHLLFARKCATVSVFSLPITRCTFYRGVEETEYESTVAQHRIAGFAKGQVLYCVVGTCPRGSLTMTQVTAIRDELRQTLSAPTPVRLAYHSR